MLDDRTVNYLNSYTMSANKIELIVDSSELMGLEIPQYWKEIFSKSDFEGRKSVILREWNKYLKTELSNTISYLNDFLVDISLIRIGSQCYLIYSIQSYQSKKMLYYIGGNPIDCLNESNGTVKENWKLIDSSITDFYAHLHNGFSIFESRSMGLDAISDVESMDEYDWEYEEQLTIDTSLIYNFFSNGLGQYIVLDITKPLESGALLWSTKNMPKDGLNFWHVIDEWIVVGFDV